MSKHLHRDLDFNKYIVERTSSRRWGYPDELRALMVFLASQASDFITGERALLSTEVYWEDEWWSVWVQTIARQNI